LQLSDESLVNLTS